MRNLIAALVVLTLSPACASLGKPAFKHSERAYNRSFEQVWQACQGVLADQVIERADLTTRQITTKPVASMNVTGSIDRTTTIKVSGQGPFRVSVITMAKKTTELASRGIASVDTFSDEDEESRLLKAIDAALSQ